MEKLLIELLPHIRNIIFLISNTQILFALTSPDVADLRYVFQYTYKMGNMEFNIPLVCPVQQTSVTEIKDNILEFSK